MTETMLLPEYSRGALKAGLVKIMKAYMGGKIDSKLICSFQYELGTFLRDLVAKGYLLCPAVPAINVVQDKDEPSKINLSSDDALLREVLGELFSE